MSKTKPPPAEVYAPHPPDYHHPHHGYPPHHGHPPHGYPHPGYQPHPPQQAPVHNTTFAPVTNQPMNQATNVVVNVGAGGGNLGRVWTTSMCGCMEDMSVCFCAWCCAPCFLAQLSIQMNECFCTPFCVPTSLMAMRIKVRESNNIRGSICQDFVCTSCCPLLTMCQMKRELDNVARKKPGTRM